MTQEYQPGQRWISDSEAELGLGTILMSEGRLLTVLYPATGETRQYSLRNAPLTRVRFAPGDEITHFEGWKLTVQTVEDVDGLLIYQGFNAQHEPCIMPETQLSNFIQFRLASDRLFAGQIDPLNWFTLRYHSLEHLSRQQQSTLWGLGGARAQPIAHQLHIAREVADRIAPRVLLADEVGLGKTIEAGLVIHRQLLNGRASRVLILVPENLQHQWLVEMRRRFNLQVALFDAERFAESDAGNPFEDCQLALVSLDWLKRHERAQQAALEAGWDLLVVDEAHHLVWHPEMASPEYRLVEQLAGQIPGVLLLTATPEQLGLDSHFARLRLLDPSRFHDLQAFRAESTHYKPVAEAVQELLDHGKLSKGARQAIEGFLGSEGHQLLDAIDAGDDEARARLVRELLDRHGTGRLLFRNTRAAVRGFPERELHAYPLENPDQYLLLPPGEHADLYPEVSFQASQDTGGEHWCRFDPRVDWLIDTLKMLKRFKVLVICAHAETALDLEDALRLRSGIAAAVFHEGMSILERDRAAAYFADEEFGAQVLICSEIGSEGRNFQFAQHLVLFDLPLNPDLLEQRIGRLDRIGQGPRIDLHVPYLEHSAQAVLLRWYDDGLDLFRRSFAAGYALFERFEEPLRQQLQCADAGLDTLIRDTATVAGETRIALQEGRDALLELNSCRPAVAAALIESIRHEETSDQLQAYMQQLWDYFGLDCETHSEHAVVVRPSDHMLVSHFPGLPDDGLTVCFDRAQALTREDLAFFTWEHPMVQAAMEMILGAEHGNACVATINIKGLQPGTLLLEAVFSVHSPAPKRLQVERFLPLSPLRVLVDRSGKNLAEILPHARLNGLCGAVPKQTAPAILKQLGDDIELLLGHARRLAETQLPPLVAAARTALGESLDAEIRRLRALAQVNPAIRTEEITFFEQQLAAGATVIARAELELQALRLVINT